MVVESIEQMRNVDDPIIALPTNQVLLAVFCWAIGLEFSRIALALVEGGISYVLDSVVGRRLRVDD